MSASQRARALMQRSLRLANRTARYTNYLGWRRGATLALLDRPGNHRIVTLTWPGYDYPFRLRLNGSDLKTFLEVIAREDYRLPFKTEPTAVVDAGANIGLASAWFAARYPTAKVLAVEPDAGNYALLTENTKPYRNVIPIQAALWSGSGSILLTDPGLGSSAYQVGSSQGEKANADESGVAPVDAVDVPTLMSAHAIDRIDVLKVDIEGSEEEVFGSSSAWIDRVDSIAIELHDRFKPGCSRVFYQATSSFPNEAARGENVFVWRSQPREQAENAPVGLHGS
jgi:FkbM family methyltransferase